MERRKLDPKANPMGMAAAVHGCRTCLRQLLRALGYDPDEADRPEVKEALQRVKNAPKSRALTYKACGHK